MNFTLTRNQFREDGIFGVLTDGNGKVVAATLEHAYPDDKGGFAPKIPVSVYTCVRGPHRLHSMTSDFITFEITDVPGHTNILFHWGNWNKDSDGCVLLGQGVSQSDQGQMINRSRVTWQAFMDSLDGVDEFDLIVQDYPYT